MLFRSDTIVISLFIKEYTGVRMTIGYSLTEKKTGKLLITGETKHCFTDRNLKPVNLKKVARNFSDKFEKSLI